MNVRLIGYVAVCSAFAWWGCSGGDGAGLDVPSLRVHAATSGVELDPDGYAVVVDGAAGRPIGVNASLEVGSLPDGSHVVELTEVAPNCEVQGPHPRSVTTASGSTADATFEVECGPSTGSVRVITRTTGSDQDEDGYVVVVNGDARPVNTNASITYEDVSAGATVIEILGVAPNCSAAGQTYHEVTVAGGEMFEVTFAFDCSPRQPDTGTLQVAIATSGPSPDADGYVVTVDGAVGQPVAASSTVLLTGLPIGDRSVALTGIAANCAVSGANPRPAAVTGTELAVVAFAVVCTQPPPATGTLRLTTATTGPDFDPTGYTIVVDGTVRQPVGVNATVAIAGLSSGSHSVALEDVTPNCTTTDNPRTISVPADGQIAVTFVVACIPAFGYITTITQTSGSATDPDGYVARVNGGAGKPVPPSGTTTRGGLAPGAHTVQLDNVASNCQVQGDNPRAVVVAGYETTTVTFEVLCGATTGGLALTVTGLPAGGAADISVTGPAGFERTFGGTTTLDGLAPGEYAVTARAVTLNGTSYQPGAQSQVASVVAGESVVVTVAYSSNPGGAINLRIAGMYVTQGSQTPEGEVPLVEGRDGYLRVFVLANGDNSVRPAVRVRMFQDGSQVQAVQIEAPTASVPTLVQEQDLNASWNLRLSGALIRRGLAIQVEVDPGGSVAESDETDNVFPLGGTPAAMTVHAASVFAVTLIPVQLGSQGLIGDVSPSNAGRYLSTSQKMHPLPSIDATLHGVFTSSLSPTQAGGTNAALSYALHELLTLRAIEGSARSYYGVTHRNYSVGGFAGLGYIGQPAAVGYDDPSDAGFTAAHEFGHNWGRLHAPCGGPANVDPQYPYVGGAIGQYGFDLANERLIAPTTHDLMSYCRPGWASDYTYLGVMSFRETSRAGAVGRSLAVSTVQPCLVVWGRIENGRPVLEPAFLVHTRPLLPSKRGPHRLRAVNRGGGQVFDISFDATPVADDIAGAEHFAFAVPIDPAAAADLSVLRLETAVGLAELSAAAAAPANIQLAPQAQRVGQKVQLQWGVGSTRMAMVRDAATGEVLAMGRGGSVELSTQAGRLDLYLSNGPSSQRIQLAVAP